MTKLSHKILDKIKKEQVTPKPKWYFILMHTLLGIAILGSIVMGSLAVAIVIRHLTLTDWELARYFTGGHLQTFIKFAPYIWLLFIGILIFLADELLKHTKKGHRTKPWIIVLITMALSLIFGSIFFMVRADEPLENSLRAHFRPYLEWERRMDAAFASPEAGVIAGEIEEVSDEMELTVVDFRGNEWTVDISHLDLAPEFSPEVGMRIGTIGERIDENRFQSRRLRPWKTDYSRIIYRNTQDALYRR